MNNNIEKQGEDFEVAAGGIRQLPPELADIKLTEMCIQEDIDAQELHTEVDWLTKMNSQYREASKEFEWPKLPVEKGNPDTYSSIEQIRNAIEYLGVQCDLMMPIDNSTIQYMECEFARKVTNLILEKLNRTIDQGYYINTRPTE